MFVLRAWFWLARSSLHCFCWLMMVARMACFARACFVVLMGPLAHCIGAIDVDVVVVAHPVEAHVVGGSGVLRYCRRC